MIHPYEFVEKPESDFYSIKLTDGPYDGVIYTYGEVQLVEDKDNDELKVKFKYKLENIPKKLKENKLKKDIDFRNCMGNILTGILEERIQNNESTDDWKPSIEEFNKWLDEWSKTIGVNKYSVYLTGAFCENYFFNGAVDTKDIDVTLEPKQNM